MCSSVYNIFKSKRLQAFLAIISALFLISNPSVVEAGGWGKTNEVLNCEGAAFSGFNFDMNGLNFHAYVPTDCQTLLSNGNISIQSTIDGLNLYCIRTSLNAGFKPQKNVKEFLRALRTMFTEGDVCASHVDAKKLGAKYVAEVTVKQKESTIFWRCLAVKDRLILMGTNDSNPVRRDYFFDGIRIK